MDKKLGDQDARIQNVSNEVELTNEKVANVEVKVTEQGEQIQAVTEDLRITKDDVKIIRAELAEAIIDIERVDRKVFIDIGLESVDRHNLVDYRK